MTENGEVSQYDYDGVFGIQVLTAGGNDSIGLSNFVVRIPAQGIEKMLPPTLINGGAGNDELRGLAGNDRLDGSAGNDRLIGGDGNDVLIGRAGRGILYGQNGSDIFHSNDTEKDILIGGAGPDRSRHDRIDQRTEIEGLF